MRKLSLLVCFIFLSVSACKKKQSDAIGNAKKCYQQINAHLGDYTKREADDITSKDRGRIVGYYRDEEVKKMYVQHFGEKSRTFTEYYFDDGALVYEVRQEFVYNKSNTYTEAVARAANDSVWYDDKKTRLEISAYYFNENKLIKWVGPNGTDIATNTAEFVEKEPILLAEALIALKQLKED